MAKALPMGKRINKLKKKKQPPNKDHKQFSKRNSSFEKDYSYFAWKIPTAPDAPNFQTVLFHFSPLLKSDYAF